MNRTDSQQDNGAFPAAEFYIEGCLDRIEAAWNTVGNDYSSIELEVRYANQEIGASYHNDPSRALALARCEANRFRVKTDRLDKAGHPEGVVALAKEYLTLVALLIPLAKTTPSAPASSPVSLEGKPSDYHFG